ncbi:MAG: hypothetical protein P9M12_05805 [Candidatus Aceula lacicola]|nr:hypothetical protein [Candidatus Aceula lacicola]
MQRIGIAASKIAKGNLFLYNFFVILLSFFISLLVFIISGLLIIFSLVIIAYLTQMPIIVDLQKGNISPISICMMFLGTIIGISNLYAIGINVKIKRN